MLRRWLLRPGNLRYHGLNRRGPGLRAQSSHIKPSRPSTRTTSSTPEVPRQETSRQRIIRYLFKPYAAPPLAGRADRAGLYARAALTGAFAFVFGHIFVTYFYACELTWGISMLPSFAASGDSVIISKYYRRGRDLAVGDVVSFKHPVRIGEYAVKRIMGMPGDFIEVAVDGSGARQVLQVPEGHCWVEGDNQRYSRDSRMFGPLPLGLVTGKIVAKCRGWRLWAWESVENLLRPAEDVSSAID